MKKLMKNKLVLWLYQIKIKMIKKHFCEIKSADLETISIKIQIVTMKIQLLIKK